MASEIDTTTVVPPLIDATIRRLEGGGLERQSFEPPGPAVRISNRVEKRRPRAWRLALVLATALSLLTALHAPRDTSPALSGGGGRAAGVCRLGSGLLH